jgi:hypothetical protein
MVTIPIDKPRGESLGIGLENYRHLAGTALAIVKDLDLIIGLYRLQTGCGLDIFGENNCLSRLFLIGHRAGDHPANETLRGLHTVRTGQRIARVIQGFRCEDSPRRFQFRL